MIDELMQELCLHCHDLEEWSEDMDEEVLELNLVDGEINAVVNLDEHIVAFDIDYCPYCGRKLSK